MTPLARFPNVAIARMVCELLRNAGIDALLRGDNFAGIEPFPNPGGFSETILLVPEHQLGQARELYDAYFAGVPPFQ